MVKPIPKWVWKRYALLWKKFSENPFTFEQAQEELKFLERNAISVLFNELKIAGWISIGLDGQDSRKRIYTLSNPLMLVENVENDIEKN